MRKNLKISKKSKEMLSLILFVAPFFLLFTIFFIIPFIDGIIMSFTNSNGINPNVEFIGFKNYIEIIKEDSKFFQALGRTLYFTVINVLATNGIAIMLAIIIEANIKTKFKNLARTLFFLPYVLALVIVGFIWRFLYTEAIPDIATSLNLMFLNKQFLGDPNNAMFSIIVMNVWNTLGYFLVIYISGLQSIDKSLIESAKMDGAKGFSLYSKVIFPLLMPAITVCVFTGIASSFKIFDAVFVLTEGGPGYATEVLALNIYRDGFGMASRFGYAMAKSGFMALILFVFSYFQLKFFKSKEVEA